MVADPVIGDIGPGRGHHARGEGDRFRTLDFVKQFVAAAGFEIVMRDDPRYYVPYHVHGRR